MQTFLRITISFILLFIALMPAGCGGSDDENPDLRLEMIDLINAERSANSVAALAHSLDLSFIAQQHADDMVARNFVEHINPDGHDHFWRVTNAGIPYLGLGENVSAGFFKAKSAHDAFMLSPAHRDNILRTEASEIGVGVAYGTSGNEFGNSLYFCVLFMQTD